MNKKLRKIAAAFAVAIVMGIMLIVISSVKGQPPAPSMYLDPATESFTINNASVGTLFNVTGWIDAPDNSTGWSAALTFDPTQIQVVKGIFTGTGGTESQWLQSSGVPGTSVVAEAAYWNNTLGTVGEPSGFGEAALAPYGAQSDVGSLFIIEFNITQAPPTGGSLTSIIQWDPLASYGFDSFGIAESGFNFGNCTYTFSSSVVTAQQITFAQSGLDSSASGTVVTVNGTAETFSQLPNITSANTGDTLTFSYQTNVSSSVSGKQFANTGVNVTSPLTVSATETVTGSYKTQYQVSFAVSPSGAGTTNPSGSNVWEDAGSLSIVATPNSGFKFSNWTATGSITVTNASSSSTSATISGPGNITANFASSTAVTYSVSFTETGLPSGTSWSVTFNGSPSSSTTSTITFTARNGNYSYSVTGPTGFAASPASGGVLVKGTDVNVSIRFVTPSTQFYLTVTSAHGSPSPPSGFFNSGTNITESVNSPVFGGTGTQYVCTGWTGTGSVPASGTGSSVTFTMNSPSNITWTWKIQFEVTIDQQGVGPDFTGTVATLDGSSYTLDALPSIFWWDSQSNHSFSFASPLIVSAGKQYTWNSTSGLSILQNGALTVTGPGSLTGNYAAVSPTTRTPILFTQRFDLAAALALGSVAVAVLLMFIGIDARTPSRKKKQ